MQILRRVIVTCVALAVCTGPAFADTSPSTTTPITNGQATEQYTKALNTNRLNDALYLMQVVRWNDTVKWNLAVAAGRRRSIPRVRSGTARGPAVMGTGACGGDLPPCSVMMCESGGSLTAQNPNSTASGKWQFTDPTWAGYGGYSRAMYAPEDVQDERARQVWNGGAGAGNWVCK